MSEDFFKQILSILGKDLHLKENGNFIDTLFEERAEKFHIAITKDDIRNLDGTMKQYITVIEKKTGKQKRFPLCNGLLTEMERYTRNMQAGEYLFKSRKGENKVITTVQAYRIINRVAKSIRLE